MNSEHKPRISSLKIRWAFKDRAYTLNLHRHQLRIKAPRSEEVSGYSIDMLRRYNRWIK